MNFIDNEKAVFGEKYKFIKKLKKCEYNIDVLENAISEKDNHSLQTDLLTKIFQTTTKNSKITLHEAWNI